MSALPQLQLRFVGADALARALRETGAPHLPLDRLADNYGIGNPALHQALTTKVGQLMTALQPHLRSSRVRWLGAQADVLALDMALVEHASQPFELAWVEIQAFTTMLPTCHTLQLAQRRLCDPGSTWLPHDPLPAGSDWVEHLRQWVAPGADTVLIEDHPRTSPAWADLAAARHWWQVDVHDWRELIPAGGYLRHAVTGVRYSHAWNRLILPDLPPFERSHAQAVLLAADKMSWHSHPAWYEGISKGTLAELALATHEACHWVDNSVSSASPWTDGQPWVAKPVQGHSSHGVLLNPDPDELAALPGPRQWIVQRKFRQVPIARHPLTGQALFGEIRCMLGLRPGQPPWVMAWILRCSTNGIATMTGRDSAPGEGMTLLYFNQDGPCP